MEVFNSSGGSGIVVLTFDDNKTLNVKFEYEMLISVEYFKDKVHYDPSQCDDTNTNHLSRLDKSISESQSVNSVGNIADEGHEVFTSQGNCQSHKQDSSDHEIDEDDDGFRDFCEPDPNESPNTVVDPVKDISTISTKNKMSKKTMVNALQTITKNNCSQKMRVEHEVDTPVVGKSSQGELVIESLKLEPTDADGLQKSVSSGLVEQESEGLEDMKGFNILSCQVCEKVFQSNEDLIDHGSVVVNKEKCLVCQKEFVSNANLLLHNYLAHRDSSKTCPVCPVCFAPFTDNLEAINHLKSRHTNEEVYKCCVCHIVFEDYSIFQKHLDNYRFKKVCSKPNSYSRKRKSRECTQRTQQKMKTCSVIVEKLPNTKQKKQPLKIKLKKTSSKSPKLKRQKSKKDDKGSDTDQAKAVVRKSFREEPGQSWHKCDSCLRLFKENWALRNHTKPHTLVDVCKKCGCKAHSKAEYLLHEYMRHSEEYKSDTAHGSKDIKCPMCEAICSSQEILNHIMSEHTKECPYVCCICDKPLENTETYDSHMKSHQNYSSASITDSQISKLFPNISFKYAGNDDKTICRLCKIEFDTQKDFLHHCQNEKEKKVCNICETPTFTEAGYIVHKYLSHGLSPDEHHSPLVPTCYVNFNKNHWEEGRFDERSSDVGPKSIKCPCCSENVNTQDLFFHVMETHTHESPFKCCACHNESSTLNEFIDHCNFHLGKKMYDADSAQCTRCNLRFDSRLSVTRHQGIWHKRFTCSLCQTSFANTILLEEHLHAVHRNEAKSCSFCGKLFSDVAALAWHERHHYYQKKIPCTICGEVLSSKRTLSFHMQVKHSDSDDLSHLRVLCTICGKMIAKSSIATHRASHSNDRSHDCSICNKTFKHRSKVLQHVTRVHMKHLKSFICDVCGKNCTTRYNLKIHMRIHSSVKAFSCSLCGQGFNYNQSLQAHIAKKHSSGPQSYS